MDKMSTLVARSTILATQLLQQISLTFLRVTLLELRVEMAKYFKVLKTAKYSLTSLIMEHQDLSLSQPNTFMLTISMLLLNT
jgi:hypothetical protein